MASIGHAMIGMAAGRLSCRRDASALSRAATMGMWAGLSLLPDIDAVGFPLGVAYGAPWGHRGATHSLVFAMGIALFVGVVVNPGRLGRWRNVLLTGAVVASHGLLDSITNGGLGCALLWPFTNHRYFAPWRPLPVAPIGRGLLSMAGLRVAAVELVVFAPFLIHALWPARAHAAPRSEGAPDSAAT